MTTDSQHDTDSHHVVMCDVCGRVRPVADMVEVFGIGWMCATDDCRWPGVND